MYGEEVTRLVPLRPGGSEGAPRGDDETHEDTMKLTLIKNSDQFDITPLLRLLAWLEPGSAFDPELLTRELSGADAHAVAAQHGIHELVEDHDSYWAPPQQTWHLLCVLQIEDFFRDAFENGKGGNVSTSNSNIEADLPVNTPKEISGASEHSQAHAKEENSDHNLSLPGTPSTKRTGIDSRQLGSPLKKPKTDRGLPLPIRIFQHDLQQIEIPLKIQKTNTVLQAATNDQKIKLEALLQRLLFPEIQSVSNDPQILFNTALQEVDSSFPEVPLNLNLPVDEHGNSPLHWLTSIANLDLVKQLVEHGANRLIGDNMGESPLVKAVKSINNYDSGTFEELLDYLYPCLILEDTSNRTILHHIVITSGISGCSAAAKYYLDILMGWIVKKQSRSSVGSDEDPILKVMDLKWVLTNMLNSKDSNGDTSLNIAARLGNISIVDALLDYGADPFIANKSGLRPLDFGAGTSKLDLTKETSLSGDLQKSSLQSTTIPMISSEIKHQGPNAMSLVDDLRSLLSSVAKDYEAEVKDHNDKLASLYEQLSMERESLAASRDKLAHAKAMKESLLNYKEQISSYHKVLDEEEANFQKQSELLGLSNEKSSEIDWDSSEFDADEPFKIDVIYDYLENILTSEFDGNIEVMLEKVNFDEISTQLKSKYQNKELEGMLPPAILLKARINAYEKNDEHLNSVLLEIDKKQMKLENKFRRVLSLCLKIEEDKVDGMLDGLLQAISSEDPHDIDTEEMQEFLNKHSV